MKTAKWNRPRDGLVAAYTPDNLILMWAGNADASPMNSNAYWWTIHAQPLKEFLWGLVNWWYITNRQMTNVETASISISKITGKIPWENEPGELITSTIWYINNMPREANGNVSTYEYDASCLWLSSPLTPYNEVKQWYYMELSSFMPGNEDLQKIKEWWGEKAKIPNWSEWSLSINILTAIPEWYCENREPSVSDSVEVSIIDPETDQKISAKPSIMYSVKSDSRLKTLTITVDGALVFSKTYTRQKEDLSTSNIDLSNFAPGKHTITVQAIDASWKMNNASIIDVLESTDDEPPFLVLEQSKKQQKDGNNYQVSLVFDDHLSWIPGWTVSANWKVIHSFDWRLALFTTNAESFDIEVKDNYGNTLNQTINLSDL